MPSDERDARILKELGHQVTAFESALATAVEQVRASVESRHRSVNGQPRVAGAELGAFAAGRMDAERFVSLVSRPDDLDSITVDRIQNAYETLSGLLKEKDALLRADVAPGGSLRDTVAQALAHIGRAFGAARVVDLSRTGRYRPADHDAYARAFHFESWSKTERGNTPPLIVHVDGADLHAGGLLEFLDGILKIVLVVRGAAPPAPLVHLVSPRTFVLQTGDETELTRFAAFEGTGVAALMPAGAARFVHDPDGGSSLWERVVIDSLPKVPRTAVGAHSVRQQAQELAQLETLAARPPAPEVPATAPPPEGVVIGGVVAEGVSPKGKVTDAPPAVTADPVDKLAAWLLNQAEQAEGT